MKQVVLNLKPVPPYDFNLTAGYATYFRRTTGAESYQDGVFQRLLDIGDTPCLANVRSLGTMDSPSLEVVIIGTKLDKTVVTKAQQRISWILGIDQSLLPFYRMAQNDSALSPLVKRLRGLHIPHTGSIYEALVLAILGQQINSHVARMLRTLLIETYGQALEISGNIYHCFPQATNLATAGITGLRAIKLSTRKAQYIVDISNRIILGQLDLEGLRLRPDEEVIRTLTSLRGVGLWTTHWLFIRALGRNDGFPHEDLALCRTLSRLLNSAIPFTPAATLEYSQRWSPFRSYVTAYLFAAIRSGLIC
ncbi:DNA-3-methyladenine glycosylase family protein [Chloroflexota bacterium]